MQKNIALMAGGNSSEYEISLKSATQIAKILDREKYNPYQIFVKGNRWFHIDNNAKEIDIDKNDFSIIINGEKIKFEYALILIHGTPGENGLLQAYFDIMEVKYSSCSFLVSAITFDKSLCKRALCETTVKTAKEVLINKGDNINTKEIVEKLGLPVFVKPNASGSSFGVTKVKSENELIPAIENAFTEDSKVLIEEFLMGCEVSCGIMITNQKKYLFPATEIISKKEFFDYEAKYTDGMSEEITPARISPETVKLLNENSEIIYRTLACKGIVRIDYIIRDSTPYMIEINTVPGMSENSIIPKQARTIGMDMTTLFNLIINETI